MQQLDTARATGEHMILRIESTPVHSRPTCRNNSTLCTVTLSLCFKALLLFLADRSSSNRSSYIYARVGCVYHVPFKVSRQWLLKRGELSINSRQTRPQRRWQNFKLRTRMWRGLQVFLWVGVEINITISSNYLCIFLHYAAVFRKTCARYS